MERAISIPPADDLGRARSLYVDGLGLSVTFEASADGKTGLLRLERRTEGTSSRPSRLTPGAFHLSKRRFDNPRRAAARNPGGLLTPCITGTSG